MRKTEKIRKHKRIYGTKSKKPNQTKNQIRFRLIYI